MAEGKTEPQEDMTSSIVYQPQYKENQIVKFTKFVEQKHGIKLGDYWELHEWSCKYFPEFWACVWDFFGIISSRPYTEVFDRNRSFENMEWFPGARLNYAENVFKNKNAHVALVAIDEWDNTRKVTYGEMYEEVCLYAKALKDHGVKKGDVVACYMTNKIEAVFAFLAAASMGVVWCGALPLLGAQALLARFEQLSLKILFTSGDFEFDGKDIKMLDKLRETVPNLPSLEKVVFVPSKAPPRSVGNLFVSTIEPFWTVPKCCSIRDFLEDARKEYLAKPRELEYEQVPFDYPLCFSFTSGTTGRPKALVHSTGAFFTSIRDFGIHQDITRKDVLMNFSPVGWISWNMFVNTLHLGLTLCMYEGSNPFERSPTRFWDLVDRFGITSVYLWSSSAEVMQRNGYIPTDEHSLETLKQIFPMGSITKPQTYDFFQKIKPGIFVESVYGTTEVFGLISGLDSNLPVYRGEMQVFSLAMDVRCLDEDGNSVVGQSGNLAIANPYPAMPIALLNDERKENVRELYLNQYPGFWFVADSMWINPVTKGFVLYGRCDETLNPKGARFSCSEIYVALENFPGLVDSVCVSHHNAEKDERAVLFVKLEPGSVLTESIQSEIRAVIERDLTYEHVPAVILQVPDIPYNLTGKKLNVLVKKLVNKMPVTNAEFVVNPKSLEFYKNIELEEF